MTPAGTYLIAHFNVGKVIEYNKQWDSIWSMDAPSTWGAVRLENGNTLISGNQHGYVREVNAAGAIVWEINKDDLPGFPLYTVHGVARLSNGNTLFSNWGGFLRKEDWNKVVQVIEVTPEKKVVWALYQWKDPDLGPSSCVQVLDDGGMAFLICLARADRINSSTYCEIVLPFSEIATGSFLRKALAEFLHLGVLSPIVRTNSK